jgi:hypothetical protein
MAEDASINQGQPWSFERILALHNRAKESGVLAPEHQQLGQFAQFLNDQTGSHMFDQGLKDSKIKRFSAGFDKLLEKTGVPEQLGSTFSDVGALISPEAAKTGEDIGKNFLRGAIDSSLVLGGMGLTATGAGATLGVPMMAVGGGSTFQKFLPGAQAFQLFSFSAGAWKISGVPTNPSIAVAEGFFIKPSAATNWVQSLP